MFVSVFQLQLPSPLGGEFSTIDAEQQIRKLLHFFVSIVTWKSISHCYDC